MFRTVYVYSDEGTSRESVNGCITALTQVLGHPMALVREAKAKDLMECLRAQPPHLTALIMPGGADLPYLKLLDEVCIEGIRSVVASGGSYIGICAGAYFASSECIFERDNPSLRIVGCRPLALVPYPAIGAVRGNFCYGTEQGATQEKLICEWRGKKFQAHVYCNGGPGWDLGHTSSIFIIARYTDAALIRHGILSESPVAALWRTYANGRVVLSGVHPELPMHDVNDEFCGSELVDEGRLKFLRSITEAALLHPAIPPYRV